MSALAVAAVAAFGAALVSVLHKSMARMTKGMSICGGLPVHPYMEMKPGRDRGSDAEMILPGLDLRREEPKDPKRA